jgi:hypothetical protein
MDIDIIGIRLSEASEEIQKKLLGTEYGGKYGRIVAEGHSFAYFMVDMTINCSCIFVEVFISMVTDDTIAAATINEILREVDGAFDLQDPIYIRIQGYVYEKYCEEESLIGFGFQKSWLQYDEKCNLLVISRNPIGRERFTSISLPFRMKLHARNGKYMPPTDGIDVDLSVHIIDECKPAQTGNERSSSHKFACTYLLMPKNPILFVFDQLMDYIIEITDETGIKWIENARLNKRDYWNTSKSSKWEGVTIIYSSERHSPDLLLFQGISINKNGENIQRYADEYREYQRLCRYLVLRTEFIVKIQRAWRRCISDPAYMMCRKRISREFEELTN